LFELALLSLQVEIVFFQFVQDLMDFLAVEEWVVRRVD